MMLSNNWSQTYLELHFVIHLYFGRDTVHWTFAVVAFTAFPLDKFEKGETWDG